MDYFDELMNSYNKLKKRSFKLTYLEEETAKPKKAKKAAPKAAQETPEQKEKKAEGEAQKNAEASLETLTSQAPQVPPGVPRTDEWVNQNVPPVRMFNSDGTINPDGEETNYRLYASKGGETVNPRERVEGAESSTTHGTADVAKGDVIVQGWNGRTTLKRGGNATEQFTKFAMILLGEKAGGEGADGDETDDREQGIIDAEARLEELTNRIGGGEARKLIDAEAAANYNGVAALVPPDVREQLVAEAKKLVGDVATEQYQNQLKIIDKFCQSQRDGGGEIPEDLQHACKQSLQYVAGGFAGSLEYKLAYGETVCIDPDTSKVGGTCQPTVGLKDQVAYSATKLLDFLQPSSEDAKCDNIRYYVGKAGGKNIVLFAQQAEGETKEGIVIKPNSLQQAAINNIIKHCEQATDDQGEPVWGYEKDSEGNDVLDKDDKKIPATLTSVIDTTFSDQLKNAVKGTLYEIIPSFILRMDEINAISNGGGSNRAKNAAIKKAAIEVSDWLREVINGPKNLDEGGFKKLLEAIATKATARDIPTFFASKIAQDQLAIIKDSELLAKFLVSEAAALQGWMRTNNEGAKDVVHLGLNPKTGGREDNGLLFFNGKQAQDSADKNGSTRQQITIEQIFSNTPETEHTLLEKRLKRLTGVDENGEEVSLVKNGKLDRTKQVYVVGFGQKRKTHIGSPKGGESETIERQNEGTGVTPLRPLKGGGYEAEIGGKWVKVKSIEEGFPEKVEDDLFGPHSLDAAGNRIMGDAEKAQVEYGSTLEAEIKISGNKLIDSQTYVTPDGKTIKSSDPGVIAGGIQQGLKSVLSFSQYTLTHLGNLFFDKDKNSKDLTKPDNRESLREGVERLGRFARMRKDYNSVVYADDGTATYMTEDEEGNITKGGVADESQIRHQRACQDHLIRNLMNVAYNKNDMSQVLQADGTEEEAGEVLVWAQNGPIQEILKARNDDANREPEKSKPQRLTIEIKGYDAVFSVDGTPLMKFSQERNWGGKIEGEEGKGRAVTRSVGTFLKGSWTGKSIKTGKSRGKYTPPSTTQNSDIFYEFLKGQQVLLEKLLTSSTERHSFQV